MTDATVAVSSLRRRMIDDMSLRNLSPATQRSYLYAVTKFSRYHSRSPHRLGLEDVRGGAAGLSRGDAFRPRGGGYIPPPWPCLSCRPRRPYPASEKLEIIRIVEQSHLPARRTLEQLDIPRRTFCRWYDRYFEGGPEALADRPSAPSRVWNRIPSHIHDQIIEMALEQSELSPRELAVRFTDEKRYFVSEATVYRLLKAHDLITSPAYVVIKAADRFHT